MQMVNHPNRSKQDTDAALRRLLTKHSLQRIDVIVTRDGVTARAMPDGFHPLVAQRRTAAFAGQAEWSLAEASRVQTEAMANVGQGHGKTLDDAVRALSAALAPLVLSPSLSNSER